MYNHIVSGLKVCVLVKPSIWRRYFHAVVIYSTYVISIIWINEGRFFSRSSFLLILDTLSIVIYLLCFRNFQMFCDLHTVKVSFTWNCMKSQIAFGHVKLHQHIISNVSSPGCHAVVQATLVSEAEPFWGGAGLRHSRSGEETVTEAASSGEAGVRYWPSHLHITLTVKSSLKPDFNCLWCPTAHLYKVQFI